MTMRMEREASAWTTKTKALAAGLLLAGMLIAGTMVASPAHAATTFTVDRTIDTPDAIVARVVNRRDLDATVKQL